MVADNDPEASARAMVEARADGFPHALVYTHAPRPGIPAARNAALRASLSWARAQPGADPEHPLDAVCVVDDDEWVVPGWLRELLGTRAATGADVVTATVEPVFVGTPPAWAVAGRFYERDRYPTGTSLDYARTSNVLVDGRVFTADGLRFASVGMPGGSDTFFFERARLRGRRIVWCDEAVAYEEVPAERVSARWLVLRQYRYGLVRSAVLRATVPSRARHVRRALAGAGTAAWGLARLVVGVADPVRRVAAARVVASGVGLVLGLVGVTYDDYREVHGR
ncbi:hypothetical protein Cma02nite_19550 [Cellulomonas marina]|uniref:Glycosyl transferase family 2 n=1 Tax=Cellulomonas marina TaxID=988821 RepID=A0A1I0X245_9CELL|nr:hypothetical protein Cma02nite_19550 [Cellulomonas marina]SFA94436.1 Glycosyl transferase family 2 [Cellulomonas marina]